jgi:GTPase Era involved in 16S rRNA processing
MDDKTAAQRADEQRDKDQAEADRQVALGHTTNMTAHTKASRERSEEKTAANIRSNTSNDGAPDKPDDNTKDRNKVFAALESVREELYDLDLELTRVGERDLADAVKRARREFELIERRGIPQARGL